MTRSDPVLDLVRRAQARREAAGLAVPFIRKDNGQRDIRYCANEEDRRDFITKCAVNGKIVLLPDYDRKAVLAAEYVERIGYDPFVDDPTITAEEVARTLIEWAEAAAA